MEKKFTIYFIIKGFRTKPKKDGGGIDLGKNLSKIDYPKYLTENILK